MSKQLIEIYLFVDPLGKKCNNARKIINEFREDHIDKVKLRLIPIVNSKKVLGYTHKENKTKFTSFVDKSNRFSTNTYHACLAFHASTMQGKKAGYNFLSALQSAVVEEDEGFSDDLVYDIAEDMNLLDLEMFTEDYNSELAKNIYHRNLKLASEMDITETPSCVIFKNGNENDGIRLEKEIENALLHTICGLDKISVVNDDHKEKNQNRKIRKILSLASFS